MFLLDKYFCLLVSIFFLFAKYLRRTEPGAEPRAPGKFETDSESQQKKYSAKKKNTHQQTKILIQRKHQYAYDISFLCPPTVSKSICYFNKWHNVQWYTYTVSRASWDTPHLEHRDPRKQAKYCFCSFSQFNQVIFTRVTTKVSEFLILKQKSCVKYPNFNFEMETKN